MYVNLGKSVFLGSFHEAKKEGFGYELEANLGNIYVGEFSKDVRHGMGEFYLMDKRMQYTGQVERGR